jgi:hypothetical protein
MLLACVIGPTLNAFCPAAITVLAEITLLLKKNPLVAVIPLAVMLPVVDTLFDPKLPKNAATVALPKVTELLPYTAPLAQNTPLVASLSAS